MRIYQCDCCKKIIEDPFTVKMKEFYLRFDADCLSGLPFPVENRRRRRIKIHLCDECYKGLNLIGELVPKKESVKGSENNV